MSRTHVSVRLETKERLEEVSSELRTESANDSILALIDGRKISAKHIDDLRGRISHQESEMEDNWIRIGLGNKNAFTDLQRSLGLRSHLDLVKLLLEHWHNAQQLDKPTFEFYMTLRS